MRLSIIAGTVATTLAVLSGCSTNTPQPPRIEAASASVKAFDCALGSIDPQRAFIRCASGRDRATDAMQAMNRPVNPALNLASIAADYGLAPGTLTSIKADQSARIVKAGGNTLARDAIGQGPVVSINGRTFRKITLDAAGRESTTLFIEG